MIEEPNQEIIINTFSENSVEEIKKFQLGIFGSYRNIDDPLTFRNVVGYDGLELTLINENRVRTSVGFCSINGTMIEIKQRKDLYPNSVNSYIFSNDDFPSSDPLGTSEDTLSVVVFYNPTESNNFAYLGLVRSTTLLNNNINYICILGELKITIVDQATTINSISLSNRDFIFNVFDGGWVY